MKERWKSMSKAQKFVSVLSIILCLIGMVFAIMHLAFIWNRALNVAIISLGLADLCQAYLNWNSNRKYAYMYLATALFIIACAIVVLFF